MSSIRLSGQQSIALARDYVQRQAGALSREVDTHCSRAGDAPATPAMRLAALRQALADSAARRAGPAAKHLTVDLHHAAARWQLALDHGSPYRETAAAAQLSAAMALGTLWPLDDRLADVDALEARLGRSAERLCDEDDAGMASRWVGQRWSAAFDQAAQRAEQRLPQARYALGRAIAEAFHGRSLRVIANAVFEADESFRLDRYTQLERRLFAASGIPADPTRRLEFICMAGDLVYGLGRCIRLVQHQHRLTGADAAATRQPGKDPLTPLIDHLTGALHDLAAIPER